MIKKMKPNYQNELDNIIEELHTRPKLLLHSCCAPCSSYVIEYLIKYFDITILYYNPNIEPLEEYLKRKNEEINFIKKFKTSYKINFLDCDYDNHLYHEIISGLENEPERGLRCHKCFYLRLNKTAQLAKEHAYDYFATTLTVSPYKNSTLINEIGYELSKIYNINYLPSDFKKKNGYKRSIELSREYNLYRQNYCGCIYSQPVK